MVLLREKKSNIFSGYNGKYNVGRDTMQGASTMHQSKNQFGPQYKNLASVIRGFKSAVTTSVKKNHLPFDWQSGFHDHIIRNETSYHRIRNYIIQNLNN